MNKYRKQQQQQQQVSPAVAIAACDTLVAFLRPMLREAQRDGELGAVAYISPLIADIAALRGAVAETLQEEQKDRQLVVAH